MFLGQGGNRGWPQAGLRAKVEKLVAGVMIVVTFMIHL
jgi:hypothetical protein